MEPTIVFGEFDPPEGVHNELLASVKTLHGMFPERTRLIVSDSKGNLFRAELWQHYTKGPEFLLKPLIYNPQTTG